jgi:hypothetical protein
MDRSFCSPPKGKRVSTFPPPPNLDATVNVTNKLRALWREGDALPLTAPELAVIQYALGCLTVDILDGRKR